MSRADSSDYMDDAYDWTRGLWTMDRVREELESGFQVVFARNSLRNLLVELGIGPIVKLGSGDDKGGPGRVGYYDPLVCWVAYVASRCGGLTRADMAKCLDDHRDTAREAVWGELAYAPKKRDPYDNAAWDWRVESTAYHLFITDDQVGLDPRTLHGLLAGNPRLLYLTLDSNMCLESVLRVYVARYLSRFAGVEVEANAVNLFGDTRDPLFSRQIIGTNTLGVLDQFGALRHGGSQLTEPDHVYFDHVDPRDAEWGDA